MVKKLSKEKIKFDLQKSLFTFKNLYLAYLDCRKRKRNTINALQFESNLEENLWDLLRELKKNTYRPGRSVCFVSEEPVIREIFAADFRDRVVHHLFVRCIEEHFEKYFIYDSYACRAGKGTLFAMKRLQKFLRRVQNIDPKNCGNWYYLKADITGFFMHINKEVLYGLVLKKIPTIPFSEKIKEELTWLLKVIVFYDPTKNYYKKGNLKLFQEVPRQKSLFGTSENVGLPIGNLTSQFFANVYLDKLDQFAKRELRCRFYGRYADDFYIIDKDKRKLKEFQNTINSFLKKELFLELNLKKCHILPLHYGIDFTGYFVKFYRVYPRRRIVKKFKNKIWRLENLGEYFGVNSYLGYFSHTDSYNLVSKIKEKHPWIRNFYP